MIMNAGSTATGQAFAPRQLRRHFHRNSTRGLSVDATAKMVAEIKRDAQNVGARSRFTPSPVVGRANRRSGGLLPPRRDRKRRLGRDRRHAEERKSRRSRCRRRSTGQRRYFASNAIGVYPSWATPDRIDEEFTNLSRAGVAGSRSPS